MLVLIAGSSAHFWLLSSHPRRLLSRGACSIGVSMDEERHTAAYLETIPFLARVALGETESAQLITRTPAEVDGPWWSRGRKSGHSGSESNLVEAALGETVSVRDAKNPLALLRPSSQVRAVRGREWPEV
jgi:hypothetical protein